MFSKYSSLLLLACAFSVLNANAQVIPPSIQFQATTCTGIPCTSGWALTISPAPIGGTNGQIVTTAIASLPNSPSFVWSNDSRSLVSASGQLVQLSGSVALQAGQKYTLTLSTAYGGGWTGKPDGQNGQSYASYCWYYATFISTVTPAYLDAIIAANQQSYTGVVLRNSLAAVQAKKWVFQASPKISTNIEDSSYAPPITSYVPSGTIFTKGQPLTLATDVYVWTLPNSTVSILPSSRGVAVDTFKPTSGFANNDGNFYTALSTKQTTPSVVVNASVIDLNNRIFTISSPSLNMLPAKFRNVYLCTLYYTAKENGFTAANGFDVSPKSPKGLTVPFQFPADFLKHVKIEGVGKVVAAHEYNGMRYIAWDASKSVFVYISAPVGMNSTALVAHSTCAVNISKAATLPRTAHLTTESPDIQAAFGSQSWIVQDTGGGLDPYQIDLYWGEDEPMPHNGDIPAGTTYDPDHGVPVVLTSY